MKHSEHLKKYRTSKSQKSILSPRSRDGAVDRATPSNNHNSNNNSNGTNNKSGATSAMASSSTSGSNSSTNVVSPKASSKSHNPKSKSKSQLIKLYKQELLESKVLLESINLLVSDLEIEMSSSASQTLQPEMLEIHNNADDDGKNAMNGADSPNGADKRRHSGGRYSNIVFAPSISDAKRKSGMTRAVTGDPTTISAIANAKLKKIKSKSGKPKRYIINSIEEIPNFVHKHERRLELLRKMEDMKRHELETVSMKHEEVSTEICNLYFHAAEQISNLRKSHRTLSSFSEQLSREGNTRNDIADKILELLHTIEEQRKTMLTHVENPQWEIKHHFHMLAFEHFRGNKQAHLLEIAEVLPGRLWISAMANFANKQNDTLLARLQQTHKERDMLHKKVAQVTKRRHLTQAHLKDYKKMMNIIKKNVGQSRLNKQHALRQERQKQQKIEAKERQHRQQRQRKNQLILGNASPVVVSNSNHSTMLSNAPQLLAPNPMTSDSNPSDTHLSSSSSLYQSKSEPVTPTHYTTPPHTHGSIQALAHSHTHDSSASPIHNSNGSNSPTHAELMEITMSHRPHTPPSARMPRSMPQQHQPKAYAAVRNANKHRGMVTVDKTHPSSSSAQPLVTTTTLMPLNRRFPLASPIIRSVSNSSPSTSRNDDNYRLRYLSSLKFEFLKKREFNLKEFFVEVNEFMGINPDETKQEFFELDAPPVLRVDKDSDAKTGDKDDKTKNGGDASTVGAGSGMGSSGGNPSATATTSDDSASPNPSDKSEKSDKEKKKEEEKEKKRAKQEKKKSKRDRDRNYTSEKPRAREKVHPPRPGELMVKAMTEQNATNTSPSLDAQNSPLLEPLSPMPNSTASPTPTLQIGTIDDVSVAMSTKSESVTSPTKTVPTELYRQSSVVDAPHRDWSLLARYLKDTTKIHAKRKQIIVDLEKILSVREGLSVGFEQLQGIYADFLKHTNSGLMLGNPTSVSSRATSA